MFANFLSGKFANWFVNLLQAFLQMDFVTASNFYWHNIRNNEFVPVVFVALSIMPFVVLFVYWTVKRNINYLDEVTENLEALVSDESKEIILSPALRAMEINRIN